MSKLSLLQILSPIHWSLFNSVSLSFQKLGQWRTTWMAVPTVPQLQKRFNVFWKLSLNLWNRRWFNPSLRLLISFENLGLWKRKVQFAEGLMKVKTRILKIAGLSEFLILEYQLSHLFIVEGKTQILK